MTETTTTLDLSGHEIEECSPVLRWLRDPMSGFPPRDKLQQRWHIRVVNSNGKTMGGRFEWRDVPVAHG